MEEARKKRKASKKKIEEERRTSRIVCPDWALKGRKIASLRRGKSIKK